MAVHGAQGVFARMIDTKGGIVLGQLSGCLPAIFTAAANCFYIPQSGKAKAGSLEVPQGRTLVANNLSSRSSNFTDGPFRLHVAVECLLLMWLRSRLPVIQ